MNYKESKSQAEEFLVSIRSQQTHLKQQLEAADRAEQQLLGRIQLLDELIKEASVADIDKEN